MDLKNFLGTVGALKAENRLLRFAVILIAASNIIFGYLSFKASRMKQVVVIPLTSSRVVVSDKVDPEYVLEVSRFVFDNLLTYTPYTVKRQYELVLSLFDPSVYPEYRKVFEQFVRDAEDSKLTSVFIPERIEHSEKTRRVRVTGRKLTLFEDTVVEKKRVIYELEYRVKYGTFMVLSYKRLKEEKI